MNTDNKKVYPSQINTKALACRVPAADYVKFLQEAISQGINLNDWLLTKVYSDNKSINGIEKSIPDVQTNKDNYDLFPLYLETETGTGELNFDNAEELIDYVDTQNYQIEDLIETNQNLKMALELKTDILSSIDLKDFFTRKKISHLLLTYGETLEWESKNDKLSWKSDVLNVFKTID